jgi:hypothetical protein
VLLLPLLALKMLPPVMLLMLVLLLLPPLVLLLMLLPTLVLLLPPPLLLLPLLLLLVVLWLMLPRKLPWTPLLAPLLGFKELRPLPRDRRCRAIVALLRIAFADNVGGDVRVTRWERASDLAESGAALLRAAR